ncbi:unnamed protein product [Allacma fusca]|uniref:Integrase catalytic domain-containing protein n=1 Tax=Allacma fusca TaxID=39272 RepID=A0A8J2NRU2_9HEXA|nr:unnamed protein product [Allacma fusca]
MENRTNRTVKRFFTDNGTEFVNRHLKTFFREDGIKYDTSVPYCPETNGKIEREIATIKDCARTILLAANLPTKLWPEAVHTSVYIHNRVLDKQSPSTTAHQQIRGEKPNISYFSVWLYRLFSRPSPTPKRLGSQRNVTFIESKPQQITVSTETAAKHTEDEIIVPNPWSPHHPTKVQSPIPTDNPLPGPSSLGISPRKIIPADPNLSNVSDAMFSDSDDEYVPANEGNEPLLKTTPQSENEQAPLTTPPNPPANPPLRDILIETPRGRPDISFAVSRLAQFMTSYDDTHWTAAKGVLRYLKGTADMGITYYTSGNMQLKA